MPRRKQIDPKPTIYRNVKYASRLEARWAVFFDNCSNIINFEYEPTTWKLPNGWSYTPDFLVTYYDPQSKRCQLYIEIKPEIPNDDYTNFIRDIVVHNKLPGILIIAGPMYKDEPVVCCYISKRTQQAIVKAIRTGDLRYLETALPHPADLFTNSEQARARATAYRFDL
jgi:hypothetical protein